MQDATRVRSANSDDGGDPPETLPDADGGPCGFDCEDEGDPLMSIFLDVVDEVVDAIRAAETLGLGVQVRNRLVHEDDETLIGSWVVDLYADAPHVVYEP